MQFVSTPVGKGKTFPALVAHSLSWLYCWHMASPPSLCRGNTGSLSRCCMDFMLICLFFGCLPPLTFANPSCSISPCSLIQCSCTFSYLCRHLLAASRAPLFILSYSGLASFLLCKGRASVMLQGHAHTCLEKVSKILGCSRSWSKFSAPCRLKFFRASLAFTFLLLAACCIARKNQRLQA